MHALLKVDADIRWQQERGLSRYSELVGMDLGRFISPGGAWMDIGCGDGVALNEMVGRLGVRLIGVTPVPIQLDRRITQLNTMVPMDRELLKAFRGRIKLSTDIYGGLSFCADPIEALLYETLLLETGGVAAIATRPERFGDGLAVRDRMGDFFESYLKCSISFGELDTISVATGGPAKVLQVKVSPRMDLSGANFDELMDLAKIEIGMPSWTRPVWHSPDGKVRIWQIDYV